MFFDENIANWSASSASIFLTVLLFEEICFGL